jgi:hypothetical protein
LYVGDNVAVGTLEKGHVHVFTASRVAHLSPLVVSIQLAASHIAAMHRQITPALLSNITELIYHEFDSSTVESLRHVVFERERIGWKEARGKASPLETWYREATKAVDERDGRPFISWKKGKPFKAEHLFFKTIDTGRMLPMSLADFRIQLYMWKGHWEHINSNEKGEECLWTDLVSLVCNLGFLAFVSSPDILPSQLHFILIFRNRHDYGGADIPLIQVNWPADLLVAAMDYWVELSKGKDADEAKEMCQCI